MRWERSVLVTEAEEQEEQEAGDAQRGGEALTVGEPSSTWRRKAGFPSAASQEPAQKASKLPACPVSVGLDDQTLKTILLAVMGHLMFPFIWCKASLLKRAAKFF